MYGTGMGTMNVYTQRYEDLTSRILIWSRTGNEGDVWRHAKVTIPPTSYGFKV